MADTQVLGTCVFGREGSSPFSRTKHCVYSPIPFNIHFTVMGILGKDVVSRMNAAGAH